MCALRAAGRTRSASKRASRRASNRRASQRHRRSDAVHEVRHERPAELQVLPELRHAHAASPQQDFDVETRVGPRTDPTRTHAQAGPQHDVLRRRDAGSAREADADPRRRRRRRVVHARRHRSPRRPRRMPDLVPRRSVPLADPRNFRYANSQLVVRDEGSLNGVYVRISGTVRVEPGTAILVGEQVLSVRPARRPKTCPTPKARTTRRACCARRRSRSCSSCAAARAAGSIRPTATSVSIGREGNDINFPDDPFISGRHAQLQLGRRRAIGYGSRVAQRHVRPGHRRARAQARRLRVPGSAATSRRNRLSHLREPP